MVLGSPHENVCLYICAGSRVLQPGVKRARDQQNGILDQEQGLGLRKTKEWGKQRQERERKLVRDAVIKVWW